MSAAAKIVVVGCVALVVAAGGAALPAAARQPATDPFLLAALYEPPDVEPERGPVPSTLRGIAVPIASWADGRWAHPCWAEWANEKGDVALPASLDDIPRAWVSPLAALPREWTVYMPGLRPLARSARRPAAVQQLEQWNVGLELDPVPSPWRSSAGNQRAMTLGDLALAVSSPRAITIAWTDTIEPSSREGKTLVGEVDRLTGPSVERAVRDWRASSDAHAARRRYFPPIDELRSAVPIGAELHRTPGEGGARYYHAEVVTDYPHRGDPPKTEIRIDAWLTRDPGGRWTLLGAEADVHEWGELHVSQWPVATIALDGTRWWVGLDVNEDGYDYFIGTLEQAVLEDQRVPLRCPERVASLRR